MSCASRYRSALALMTAAVACVSVLSGTAMAADLEALVVVPENGQPQSQARRDRYECHNWAVEQTGSVPLRTDADAERADARARRVDKVVLGAVVGAALGGLVRGSGRHGGHDEAADGALGGAVLGAAAGAMAGRTDRGRDTDGDDADSDYVRALSACLEGRGYSLRSDGESVAAGED